MRRLFSVEEKENFTVVSFTFDEFLSPDFLKKLVPPKVDFRKGVILSGRGPIWFYGYLIHFYHPSKFIAAYDPRLGGAVVVESHCDEHEVGDLIKV
ncbi:MAG: CRISPR-associated ring nuclease Crn3/Csx3 [Nitrososphaeria archaeon]